MKKTIIRFLVSAGLLAFLSPAVVPAVLADDAGPAAGSAPTGSPPAAVGYPAQDAAPPGTPGADAPAPKKKHKKKKRKKKTDLQNGAGGTDASAAQGANAPAPNAGN
jgi:hypothetical protein